MEPPILIPAMAVSPRDDLGTSLPTFEVVPVVELETGMVAMVAEERSEGVVIGDSVGTSEVVVTNGIGDGYGDDEAFTGGPLPDVILGEGKDEGGDMFALVVFGPGEPFPEGLLEQLPPGPHGSTRQHPSKPWQL